MKTFIASLSIAAASLFTAFAVQAQDTPAAPAPGASAAAMQAISAACHDDFARLCPGITPGDGKLGACIKENRSSLSSGCKKELRTEMKAKKAAGG